MQQLLMATRNHTKYLIYEPIFRRYGFETLTLKDVQTDGAPGIEARKTPAENALAKARRYHSLKYPWVFGTDAGLEIDALNGEPGLMARRWGGRFPDDVDDETWLDYFLERMKGVPPELRTGNHVIARVIIAPDGSEHVQTVRHFFRIATEQIRPISPGAPLSAAKIGPEHNIEAQSEKVFQELEQWGVLAKLLGKFPIERSPR
jgi:inosine/xanthosine triphosphate pyrophosphatase family protein